MAEIILISSHDEDIPDIPVQPKKKAKIQTKLNIFVTKKKQEIENSGDRTLKREKSVEYLLVCPQEPEKVPQPVAVKDENDIEKSGFEVESDCEIDEYNATEFKREKSVEF
jgi:hypothetical protein